MCAHVSCLPQRRHLISTLDSLGCPKLVGHDSDSRVLTQEREPALRDDTRAQY